MISQSMPRVVLITGTSQGIGEAIARTFLKHGDIVIGCAFSPLEKAASARQMLDEDDA
jgi:short chain dehydrogenase.